MKPLYTKRTERPVRSQYPKNAKEVYRRDEYTDDHLDREYYQRDDSCFATPYDGIRYRTASYSRGARHTPMN